MAISKASEGKALKLLLGNELISGEQLQIRLIKFLSGSPYVTFVKIARMNNHIAKY